MKNNQAYHHMHLHNESTRKRGEQEAKRIFEELMLENFTHLMKSNPYNQEVQQILSRINLKRLTLLCVITKLSNIKDNEGNLRSAR